MKKIILSIIAATALCGTLVAVDSAVGKHGKTASSLDAVGVGFLINDDSRPTGFYSFSVADATSPTLVARSSKVSAGAMSGDGTYYALTYSSGADVVADSWCSVDVSTGKVSAIKKCGEGQPLYVDMTYDHSAGKLMAIYHYGNMSTALCEVNPADGSAIPYVTVENNWLATVACTYDGDIYSLSADGYLYLFDKATRQFGKVGFTLGGIEYIQTMEFDHAAGTLYWAASTADSGRLYTVDINTGEATYISDMGSNGELTGFYIPYTLADPEAPAAVKTLDVANPAHDGNVVVSVTLPAENAGGALLESITAVVAEVDGVEIGKLTDGLHPGGNAEFQVEVTEGTHRFKVYAVNEAGNGLPKSVKTFVGEDVPAATAEVKVTGTGARAVIEWDAVTEGAHGGYINLPSLVYDVVRQPGGTVVASGIATLSCTDEVQAMGAYTYEVTPSTSRGRGNTAVSPAIVLGTGMALPYSCDFENPDDLLLWTVADVNNDGITWTRSKTLDGQRTMMMRGDNSIAVDEWLVTPPLRLEAGKTYKIVYDAGCMNIYYPASYSVAIGRSSDEFGKFNTIVSKTTDLRFLNREYLYLPEVEETGIYYIGFHAMWKPSLAVLYVSNVTVEENRAASLKAVVTDGKSPIAGAEVKFGDRPAAYVTDGRGEVNVSEIEPGEYEVTVSKFGYEPTVETLTFQPLEEKNVIISMTAVSTSKVTGRVVNNAGYGIENASVHIHGYDNYHVVTDRDGVFTALNVYRGHSYAVDVHAVNYETRSLTVEPQDGSVDLGEIELADKLMAPGKVSVTSDRQRAEVKWAAPEDKPVEFRYDDGTDNYVFNMEMSAVTDYTAVGVLYDTPAVFTSMSWNVWDSTNGSTSVDVLVFDLDSDGKPTGTLLYEENGLPSSNGVWCRCEFRYPVVAPRGALIALRGDARLCMDSGGENPDYPAMRDKMMFTHDYRTEPFHSRYEEDNTPVFRGNLTLRATGMLAGAPRRAQATDDAGAVTPGYNVWRMADGAQGRPEEWTRLTETPVVATEYVDEGWNGLAKGAWRYAVKALYSDGYESYATISDVVLSRTLSAVTLTFSTNIPGESAEGAKVVLAGVGNTFSHTAVVGADGAVVLNDVHEGRYALTCSKKGFITVSEEIEVSGSSDFAAGYVLAETTKKPDNLMICDAGDETKRLLRWNVITGIFDDFEGHDDWAVNSPGEVGWSYVDGDEAGVYTSPNYTFPNSDVKMAFMVMNPSAADPDMVEAGYMDTHSGEKALVAWSTINGEPNDDYIISPRLEMDGDFVISFWARCYWSHYVETLRVGYSLTGTVPGDFTWIGDKIRVDNEDWRQFVVNIPKQARFVAINCVSENNYYLAIDDIFIGSADMIPDSGMNSPQTAALRAAGERTGYEVYLDNVKLATTTATEHMLENLTEGSHVAGVKACYGSGTTEMAVIAFDVKLSGVADATTDAVKVKVIGGSVVVSGVPAGEIIEIYGTDGTKISRSESDGTDVSIALRPGIYVVHAGVHSVKVAVG